jgi:endonuclease/exonuclease/phosphatase (EEP) superfamily protein YafD
MRWLWRIAAGFVLAATVAGFLGRFGEPFELLSNFRVQFLILAAMLIAPAAVTRDRAAIAMVLLAMAGNALGIAPRTVNTAPEAPAGATPTRIVWANLYRKQEALDRLAAWLREHPADVVAVTELPPGGEDALHRALPDFSCVGGHQNDGNPFAVAIAVRTSPCFTRSTPTPADVHTLSPQGLTIVALHSRPPWDNHRLDQRDRTIAESISLAKDNRSVIVGDFNATPWSPVFRAMDANHLHRADCGAPWRPTWRSQNPLFGLTLDQAWLGPAMGVVSCDLGPDIGSDHRPLVVVVGSR